MNERTLPFPRSGASGGATGRNEYDTQSRRGLVGFRRGEDEEKGGGWGRKGGGATRVMKRRQVHPTHLHHFRKWRSPCSARTRAPDQTSCSTIRALSARWASARYSAGLCISMLKRNFCLLYKTILLFTLEESVNAACGIKGLQAR